MVYKTNESIIVIQAEATSPNRTNVVFWSHDRGTAKLRMKLVRKDGIPQSLPEGTTVPIRLMFKSATAEGGYGKHDYLATIEDPVNGIVSIVLEDNILGYVGTVEGSVYIDFPNDRSLDTAGRFTFYIKRSPIDDSTPELEDYYFNGFSQTIDKIEKILADGKLEIEQKIAESETQIDAKLKDTNDKITKANQDVATLNTNIEAQKEKFDAVSIYNKAEVDSKVADLDSVKADKTALSQTNILLANGLNSKVDKGGNEQISMGMLTTEVKKAMTGGSVAVVDDGSVNTSAVVNDAITTPKRTRLGEMGLVTIFNGARMDFDFVNRKITIPATANIINRKDKYEKTTPTELPFISGTSSITLLYDTGISDFILLMTADVSKFKESMITIAHLNTASGYVSCPSDHTINGVKAQDMYYNYPAYYGGNIGSERVGTSVKLTFSTPLQPIYIKTRNGNKSITLPSLEVTVDHNYSLVADMKDNTAKVINSDQIKFDYQTPLLTVHQGLIKYTILSVKAITTHEYDGVIAYPSGEITATGASANGVKLIFTDPAKEFNFYVKTHSGNHTIDLKTYEFFDQTDNSITIRHNYSLVFNDVTKLFEIVDSNNLNRQQHIVLLSVHRGLIKWNAGLRINTQNLNDVRPLTQYKRPINKRDLYVSQAGCTVGDQIWLFEDAGAGHEIEKNVWKLNANDLTDAGTIKHTMAHCNGADYIDGYLLVFNGQATPPEINITKGVTKDTPSLYFTSPNNTQIVFKEGTKQLEGDGSACFGEAFNIVYYAGYNGIYKILLGTGANDLSDKTDDKSDMSSWGTFITGKADDEYNGTAKILKTYTGASLGQPQDMTFDGQLYIQTGYATLNCNVISLDDTTGNYLIKDILEVDVRDNNYVKQHIEPEAITFYKDRIILGGRGDMNMLASIYRQ
ncbi:phage baseplate upper protein [Enterococcus faecium]|uniref:phage baseplate upper protein n=3 Tax=Enterococcus faecium TaxID=1352 RepID=UPI0021F18F09|nr:phage baseplate upper protein [Enterococcus faecium]MCV6663365.1 phage baseplate upper protein [Enterococcus faecium]